MQMATSVEDFANVDFLSRTYALALMETYIQTPIRLARMSLRILVEGNKHLAQRN